MKIKNNISPTIIQAAVMLLLPYCPELSPENLLRALKKYDETHSNPDIPKPLTIKEAAEFLGVSTATINRMLNAGKLKRLAFSRTSVRVDRNSVERLIRTGKQFI